MRGVLMHALPTVLPDVSRQAGVGLVEIMIAVVVLALGILSIVALQTRAVVDTGDAAMRSVATIASYSILEAMRVLPASARAGAYNGTVSANACPDPGTLIQNQLHSWCQSLGMALVRAPTTQGKVDCTTKGVCTVTVIWTDTRSGTAAGGGPQTVVTQAHIDGNA